MLAFLVLLGLVVLGTIFGIAVYNGLVTRRNGFQNAFSQIDVQLRRRHDLIPNLVETAKGYLKHERETLEAVVARRRATRANRRRGPTWPAPRGP
jgi:LemA protein